jgi:hypothetical protein
MCQLSRAAAILAEEQFRPGKDCFGLDECQVRLYTAIARHTVLVMAALAICAITAALLKRPHQHAGPAAGPARAAPLGASPGTSLIGRDASLHVDPAPAGLTGTCPGARREQVPSHMEQDT